MIFSFLFLFSCGNKIKNEKFDSKKWKTGTQIDRGNMSTDLVKSNILIGKNKPEIIALLGQPQDSSDTNFHYLVDFGYMTPYHLDVTFDTNNLKVNKVDLSD